MNEGSTNKGLIWAVVAILVVAVGAFLLFANNDDSEETAQSNATSEQSDSDQSGDVEEAAATENIVEIASANPDFSTLVEAIQAANLVETLSGEGPFTVFAPTNAAFEDALAALDITAEELLARDDLGDILTYHVVAGEVLAADVVGLDGQEVETVNGATVTIRVEDNTVFVNDAQVVTTDIRATNGVIHVIDSVLLPPTEE